MDPHEIKINTCVFRGCSFNNTVSFMVMPNSYHHEMKEVALIEFRVQGEKSQPNCAEDENFVQ